MLNLLPHFHSHQFFCCTLPLSLSLCVSTHDLLFPARVSLQISPPGIVKLKYWQRFPRATCLRSVTPTPFSLLNISLYLWNNHSWSMDTNWQRVLRRGNHFLNVSNGWDQNPRDSMSLTSLQERFARTSTIRRLSTTSIPSMHTKMVTSWSWM